MTTYEWILDGYDLEHSCIDINQLRNAYSYRESEFDLVNGKIMWTDRNHRVAEVPIVNVLLKPQNDRNIISTHMLLSKGFNITYIQDRCEIYRHGVLVLDAIWKNGNYVVNTEIVEPQDTSELELELNVNFNSDNNEEEMNHIPNKESGTSTDAIVMGPKERIQNVIHDEIEQLDEMCNVGNMSDLNVKLIDGDIKTAFDTDAAIGLDLEVDWPTSLSSEIEINVDNDDRFVSTYEYDSPINSMEIIIINSLSLYADYESFKAPKSFTVSQHFNGKLIFKGATKTDERSFLKHKQSKKAQDSLPLLHPSGPLQEDTLYRGKLAYSTNIEKIKSKWEKHNFKTARTYECNMKIPHYKGSTVFDVVVIAKPFLKIIVNTRFMCLNSELVPTSTSYGRKISFVMNICPEYIQEFFNVFSCLLCMGNPAKKEDKQISNNYPCLRSIEEQSWHNQWNDIWLFPQAWFSNRALEQEQFLKYSQRQTIENGTLEEITQFHLKTIKCKLKIRGASLEIVLFLCSFRGSNEYYMFITHSPYYWFSLQYSRVCVLIVTIILSFDFSI